MGVEMMEILGWYKLSFHKKAKHSSGNGDRGNAAVVRVHYIIYKSRVCMMVCMV